MKNQFISLIILSFLLNQSCDKTHYSNNSRKVISIEKSSTGQTLNINLTAAPISEIGFGGQNTVLSQKVKQPGGQNKELPLKQGSQGTKIEAFYQSNGAKVVDILLVLDTSASMSVPIAGIADQLTALTSALGGISWRIKIVPSNPNLLNIALMSPTNPDPNSRKTVGFFMPCGINESDDQYFIFNNTDPKVAERFSDTITQISKKIESLATGSLEELIFSASQALTCDFLFSNRKSWLRRDSNLAVVFITNSDSCQTGSGTGQCYLKVGEGNMFPTQLADRVKHNLWQEINTSLTDPQNPLKALLDSITDIKNVTTAQPGDTSYWNISTDGSVGANLAKAQYPVTLKALLSTGLPLNQTSARSFNKRDDCSAPKVQDVLASEVFGIFKPNPKGVLKNWAYRYLVGKCDQWSMDTRPYGSFFTTISNQIVPFFPDRLELSWFKLMPNPKVTPTPDGLIPSNYLIPDANAVQVKTPDESIGMTCPQISASGIECQINPNKTISFKNLSKVSRVDISYTVGSSQPYYSFLNLDPNTPVDKSTLKVINTDNPSTNPIWTLDRNFSYIFNFNRGINQINFDKGVLPADRSNFKIEYKTELQHDLRLPVVLTYAKDQVDVSVNDIPLSHDKFRVSPDGKAIHFTDLLAASDQIKVFYLSPANETINKFSYAFTGGYDKVEVKIDNNSCPNADLTKDIKDNELTISCASNPNVEGRIIITAQINDQVLTLTTDEAHFFRNAKVECHIGEKQVSLGSEAIFSDNSLTIKASVIRDLADDTVLTCIAN